MTRESDNWRFSLTVFHTVDGAWACRDNSLFFAITRLPQAKQHNYMRLTFMQSLVARLTVTKKVLAHMERMLNLYEATYCIMATGPLSILISPEIPGISSTGR